MRSMNETKARWDATLGTNTNFDGLKAAVKNDTSKSPCITGLRSICWKAFLLFRGIDQSAWSKVLSDSRSAYTSLKEHFLKNVENADDLSAEDPLTGTETSPWNTLRLDEELRSEIYLDVERCMPENLYYREPATQNILLDILFIYCKLNRDVGYRQGMHEVLAPIVWVISRDAVDHKTAGTTHHDLEHNIVSNLDQNYIEHDAFTLFGVIMQQVKTFYEMGNNGEPATSGLLNNSPIVERSKRIHENYLYHADPELAEHLTAIEILPQIFLIRWIRLLFGREFPFEDVLALWDVLFAEDPGLELVDMISVAMLLRIRWQLLEADYSAALTLLLRYPVPSPPHGPATFVADALYLRDNILLDGGDHIISKYSRRAPETTVTRKLPKKIKRARTAEQEAAQNAVLSRPAPARTYPNQGSIEAIIHEAAKGVYSRSEKWGVGKALRGAMQGLQSGHGSPARVSGRSRWSLDSGKMISDTPAEMIAKARALEQRNKSLAKLLENAVDELWMQQKQIHDKDNEAAADALSLSIAKVQFVQVYLENSTMPLPTDVTPPSEDTGNGTGSTPANEGSASPSQPTLSLDSPHTNGSLDEINVEDGNASKAPKMTAQESRKLRKSSPPSTPKTGGPLKASSPAPRPSLEKSPFSWMLGDDQPKSEFVAASPFQPERTGGHSRKLFGDPGKGNSTKAQSRADGPKGDEDNNDDVFTLGLLKGTKGR